MSIKLGNIDVSYFKLGGDDVSIYLGSEKLYPEAPSSFKYMLTLSDSSTVSAECDSTSSVTSGEVSSQYSGTVVSAEIGECVTEIGDNAFYKCSGLTNVTIPSSVTSIGIQAFSNCSSLTSIDIPDSVTSIGDYVFGYCTSLTSVTISDSITTIGSAAFQGCRSLTSIDIPNSVTSIGSYAFNQCSGLTSVDIPSGVTSISSNAFNDCSSITSITVDSNNAVYDSRNNCNAIIETNTNTLWRGCNSTVIPSDVTSIGNYAFAYCRSLTSMAIPSSVTSIGGNAFNGCSSLTIVNIPSGVTSIGSAAFNGCRSLTSVDIPSGVTSISSNAFQSCASLTSITIPSGVTSIGNYAFNSCSSLASVDIPSGVTSIGGNAFRFCSGLTSVTVNATTPPTLGSRAFDGSTCPIYVPSGSVQTFKAASGWSAYASRIQAIPTPPFEGKYMLTLSDSSTVSADCDATSAITQGEISTYKSTLVSAEIGNCVASIVAMAFSDCSSLTSVDIPNSVTSIGWGAFYQCSGLTSVSIPSGVTSINRSTFQGCSSLTSIDIPSGVTSINRSTFQGCSSLTSIDIPSGVTSIGRNAFNNTPWWNSYSADTSHHYGNIVYINDVAYIAVNTGVTSVAFKNGTKSISDSAFDNCRSLTSVDIPDSVTSIGGQAFYNCEGLASVTVNATTPPTLGSSVFNNTNICPIYVPSGSVQTYKAASGWNTYASRIEGKGIPHDYSQDYLTFVVENGGTIVWKQVGTGSTKTISYSKDSGSTWTSISSTTGGTSINVSDGDIVLFKGTETAYAVDNKNYSAFESGGTSTTYRVEGNIMSLLYGDNFVGQTALTEDFTFCSLFKKNTNLYNAENLILPSTTLRESCYRAMFSNCSINTIPKLPATTLAPYCYYFMFENCKRLSSVPTNYLSVTSLSGANNCYSSMFKGCNKLTTAPQLPATTLTTDCYNAMFSGCTSLSAITCLATDISASNCTTNWVKGVAANGTFTKAASMNDWSTGVNGIPSGWTVTDYT